MDRFKTKSKLFKLTCCGGVICNTCRSLDFKRKTKKYLLISSLIILYDFKKSNTTARRSPTVELIWDINTITTNWWYSIFENN